MEEDDFSAVESPAEFSEQADFDKQNASLQTYLNALPYECESLEDMQENLEEIVGMIYVCAKSKNWNVLTSWDGLMQCWLLMRYPMTKDVRARLVRLYYELTLLPGIEPRIIRGWADMQSRLLGSKLVGHKRKLEPSDLQLSWRPLWEVLQKEVWPKSTLDDTSRNMVNIFLYVADQCKRYFPGEEIPAMLDTFLPLLTRESVSTIVPVIVSFMPPTQSHLYLPVLFKLWEGFNSGVLDERILELCGELSEEHVAGPFGDYAEGGAKFQDVGIWSQSQWELIMGKGLVSLNVPVGAMKGGSTTAQHADVMSKANLRIKKSSNRIHALARAIIYSLRLDGEIRVLDSKGGKAMRAQVGYPAGSKALDSLEKLITCTESFFHPSNTGQYTLNLTTLIQRLGAEFIKRWKEEELPTCRTPVTHRLTSSIRKTFVTILRTPALLAMFSKDAVSMSFAQGALRSLASLEPDLIMPELLDRAYGGLEVVNETHRTTAVLSMLSGVARPLASERLWLGGQKHIVPLLELSLPGIDLNDPVKTICTTMFVVSIVQHIKIDDLTRYPPSISEEDEEADSQDEPVLEVSGAYVQPKLSREEERAVTRESTAGFADWVVSLFRRVFALYEYLPEEGGKKGTTGGKQEEGVLSAIKGMLNVVCLHLSDPLFDLVLKLVYDYVTTNAKSNAVRAFGQLVACLARVQPQKTIDKFLPYCISQIEEELKHGASSVRTTSVHLPLPSDTTLHWNMAILRGSLGSCGSTILPHKERIINLIKLLIDKTKSERGYTSTGRLITRVLTTISSTYPRNSRFVNSDEWESPEFEKAHNLYWGRLYEAKEVAVDWHVPNDEEISLVLRILEEIGVPLVKQIERLFGPDSKWDNVSRNDFCRYLHALRSIWLGLPVFLKEMPKTVTTPCVLEFEQAEMLVHHLDVEAGFTLDDPSDPRYQQAAKRKQQFMELVLKAAAKFRSTTAGEDHIDAIISVTKAIDTCLNCYAISHSEYESTQKNYSTSRDLNRTWVRQKDNSRLVFVKRAQLYHAARLYMHSLYRRRSELDDRLLQELVELSLSPYTRIRRQAQNVVCTVTTSFVRSTRYILPALFKTLEKGNDPDRMKGALYLLWNKGIAGFALSDITSQSAYLLSLLSCHHEEKPSIQKLVSAVAHDSTSHLSEEAVHTDNYTVGSPGLDEKLEDLKASFSEDMIDNTLLERVSSSMIIKGRAKEVVYQELVSSIVEVGLKPETHWRYTAMALRFLSGLLRRDATSSPTLLAFLFKNIISPQTNVRHAAQKALTRQLAYMKIKNYSKSGKELWLDQWKSPFSEEREVGDPDAFLQSLQGDSAPQEWYLDQLRTGFIAWSSTVKVYKANADWSTITWDPRSTESLDHVREGLDKPEFLESIVAVWAQESNKSTTNLDVRPENLTLVKYLAKMFPAVNLDKTLDVVESLIFDPDKYKQRAGGEILAGILRGSKHWPPSASQQLWTWFMGCADRLLTQIKPDTFNFWETVFHYVFMKRDPRRFLPLIEWVISLPVELSGDSAFQMSKPLALRSLIMETTLLHFRKEYDRYVQVLFESCGSSYAEIRQHVCQGLHYATLYAWQPWYRSTDAFLAACNDQPDPLRIRDTQYMSHLSKIVESFPQWRASRLPPPFVAQSEYDKVGLTLLQWIWVSTHGAQSALVLPYAIELLPEFLRMTELNDSGDLALYSSAVLYILSAVTPPKEYITTILDIFVRTIKSSTSWKIRLNALPPLVVFFYRNLLSISQESISYLMDLLLDCLADENVEVREMASKMFSGVVRCSQRQSIIPLKNRFVELARRTPLPPRRDPGYTEALRKLHSAILGLCGLIETHPYSIEPWMPPLTEVLAPHATDPPPISTTIRNCASEFKKTHQDTWHKDQLLFEEEQLQSLSTMLVGTSYCTLPGISLAFASPHFSFIPSTTHDSNASRFNISFLSCQSNIQFMNDPVTTPHLHSPRPTKDSAGWFNLQQDSSSRNWPLNNQDHIHRPIPISRAKFDPEMPTLVEHMDRSQTNGRRWRLNSSGQLVDADAESASWELADEIGRLKIGEDTGEVRVSLRTPPKSKLTTTVNDASPLDSSSTASIDSSPHVGDHRISHSRGSSADTSLSRENKERPHSFSGGLPGTDTRRTDTYEQQWSPNVYRDAEPLSYPSLAPRFPYPPPDADRDDQVDYQRAFPHQLPPPPPFVQSRANGSYRQTPRAFPAATQNPTSLGYHTSHLSLGNTQQLYEMMMPHDTHHPAVTRVQQQHNVFRATHHHSSSDPSALRDPGTLALLNSSYGPGMFQPGMPPAPSMMYSQYYGPDMVPRLQTPYTGPYGVAAPTPSAPLESGLTSPTPSANGSVGGPSANNRKLGLYKTELCRSWEEKGTCRYGAKCQFAHGEDELRKVSRHPKYKTEICKTFWVSGSCPYGKRCCFIHTELSSSTGAGTGGGTSDSTPSQSERDHRERSNSDPDTSSTVSLLARISQRSQEAGNGAPTPVDTNSFPFTRPPTGSLRVDTSALDGASMKQNKSAYPSFASNGILMPAPEHITAKSPVNGPVTAGPDLGRHNLARLEIVGFPSNKKGSSTNGSGNPRHSFNGTDVELNFSPSPPAGPGHSYSLSTSESPQQTPTATRGNGHVRAGSAGNWASFSRSGLSTSTSAFQHGPSPAGEIMSPWSSTDLAVGSRLHAEKTWAT